MSDFSFLKDLSRRDFVKILSVAGTGTLIYPGHLLPNEITGTETKVVIVEDKNATSGNTINAQVVRIMIDEGIKELTGIKDTGEAWKSLFPGIDALKTIALKVNCINSSMSTHPTFTYAVADSISTMKFGNQLYNNNNIIIYDRTTNELKSAKYTINTTNTGVRCFATNQTGIGYSTETYNVAGNTQKISKIVTEIADYLVNLAVMKNHSGAGVTLCMKNHYGTCNNPGNLHGDYCNEYIPALNALEPIKSKQKVFIVDALYGVISGGPGGSPQVTPKKIIMGTDIVAVDYYGRKLLADSGCKTTGSAAKHIDTAASKYNLGIIDPQKIELINIKDPSTPVSVDEKETGMVQLEQNTPNPFEKNTTFRFNLTNESEIEMLVYDLNGTNVRHIASGIFPGGYNTISWDGTTDDGSDLPTGIYICSLNSKNFNKSIILRKVN
jgi:uncharacterized protein (DUF362 family)